MLLLCWSLLLRISSLGTYLVIALRLLLQWIVASYLSQVNTPFLPVHTYYCKTQPVVECRGRFASRVLEDWSEKGRITARHGIEWLPEER